MNETLSPTHESGHRSCPNCGHDPKAPWRNGYFQGKMLTKRDFRAEQRYFLELARRHNTHLHGWGIVCGLEVLPHPVCPRERIIVTPGVAIDALGREIVVPERRREYEEDGAMKTLVYGAEVDIPPDLLKAAPRGRGKDEDDCYCPPPPPPIHLYLCLHYKECLEEWTNAPFETCDCGKQAAEIFDGYCFELTETKPDSFTKAEELCGSGARDCDALLYPRRQCAPRPDDHCVPLARLSGCPGEGEWEIDGHARVPLPSTAALAQAVRCLTRRPQTRITNYNWGHDEHLDPDEFVALYIGDDCHRRGFDVEFSAPLHADTVRDGEHNPLVFQATFIFHESHGAGRSEIAPAKLARLDDTRLRLELDHHYGRKLESCRHFNVLLQLRCNFLLDQHGCAVDGNLVARLRHDGRYEVPRSTGDRVAGGLFESWIRVHRH